MKIFKNKTVFNESLDRIRYLFDEFPEVIVGVSGGKDSTVIFNLALMVAHEKKRLPLRVFFLDQEIEWKATIDQIKRLMYHPDVKPMWMQIHFRLFNATSTTDHWLDCWNPKKRETWMREKDPVAIKENIYHEDRFGKMFEAIIRVEMKGKKACYLTGVRTEESPARAMGVTYALTYKGISWGKILNKVHQHYTFHPIYDWSYLDVWKAIHDNKWPYNKIYDLQYMHGMKIRDMRVSNLHHETSVKSLFYLQEAEPDTYEKATQRIKGLDMAGKLGFEDYFIHKLPFMFVTWKDYRDYLLEKLIADPVWKAGFINKFTKMDIKYAGMNDIEIMYKMQVQSILTNDWEFIKIRNWESTLEVYCFRKWRKIGAIPPKKENARFIPL